MITCVVIVIFSYYITETSYNGGYFFITYERKELQKSVTMSRQKCGKFNGRRLCRIVDIAET